MSAARSNPPFIPMPFLSQIPAPWFQALGPAALILVAILMITVLTRPRSSRAGNPTFVRRRRRLPRGVVRWALIGVLLVSAMPIVGVDLQSLWSTLVPVLSLVAIGFVAMWSILSHM